MNENNNDFIPEEQNSIPTVPGDELSFSKEDIEANKTMAILSYLLFFLPLLSCPDSRFARYHANQSLLNVIFGFVIGFIGGLLAPFTCGISMIVTIVPTVFLIMGMINASKGEAKPLPLIGKLSIIKVDK